MRQSRLPLSLWIARCAGWVLLAGTAAAAPVDFNRDIRPLLSDHCYACHGPDEQKRKADLRLDRKEDAFRALKSGHRALVSGDAQKSALITRIRASDPDELMPPAEAGKPLTEAQRALLERWVSEGAPWQEHWSFVPPQRPELPPVRDTAWPRNELDRFVLARLETGGLRPNPEADRATLLRRVTLDLTGLPPSIEDVDAFLADERPDAYEHTVDRLLGLPQYGERMAAHWMDLARFADTSGYHFDGVRFMWLWRDWVIRAFNENLPYDRFTVEQLAGDLLPHPTQSQRVATGFVRNNMTNDEGGADPDEYLNKYVVDRVNTLGAVWLGMTVGCTECHDHKYDPMTTREFYRLYAFFHNVPEKGLDRIRTDNPPPRLPVPTPGQALQLVEAEFTLKDAEKTLQDRANELGETQEKWERELMERPPSAPETLAKALHLPLDGNLAWSTTNSVESVSSVPATTTAANPAPTPPGGALRFDGGPEFVDGRLGKALKLDGRTHVDLGSAFGFDRTNAASLGGWIRFQGNGAVLSRMEKGPGLRGFDVLLADGRAEVHLIHVWPDNALKVRTREPLAANQWQYLWVTYDGSGKASGVKLYVNGRRRDLETQKDQLKDSIATAEPLRLGSRHGDANLPATLDDWRFLDREATEAEIRDQLLADFLTIVRKSRGQRTDEERADLARFYRESHAVDYLRSEAALADARRRKDKLMSEIPTTLIMEEMDPPRPTFVLTRGDFRNRGESVTAGTPAFLPPLPEGPANRLSLARWLVAPEHPLMARVTVNRLWALFFGTGLVKTANDFGSQGEWPSHPELLDWMAVQFREGGGDITGAAPQPRSGPWDVKGMIRRIVTSAAYRQSAQVSSEKLERDPYNRLITRGPRLRLDAEFIRDNALSIAGLLNPVIGGPSVKPYQPAGIWDGTDSVYTQDKGDLLYRRGLYVFWRRSAHYPPLATFDAPNREVCTFARQRTQTPLQSLVLMNDPGFVEAARGLAQRVLREEPADLDRRLLRAFRHTLGRRPTAGELEVLHGTYRRQWERFQEDPDAADALLKIGESPVPEAMPKAELAAMTTVANVLLNLNETITK